MTTEKTPSGDTPGSDPWWRYPLVWMVIAGPAAVVVAGFATLWLAIRTPDPVVAGDYYRRGIEINQTLARDRSLAPAQQGRNHAATPAPASGPQPAAQ
ncbi:FixH family protein [Polaromonas sp.]|uniref:FixH family protein n=1 Tax=Polaromonas sp. TaxID=1869339 RepID=UPI003750F91D